MSDMIDPRVAAVAEWMRDREDGASGWANTNDHHKAYLMREAEYVIAVADRADPLRNALQKIRDEPPYELPPIDFSKFDNEN